MPDPAPALKSDFIDPKKLANHPLNAQLYGTKPDAEFVSSVRRLGVLEPVEITQSGIIISGHRRRQAAIIAELEAVPVRVHTDELTDLEIRQRIIEANRQRKKTTEEIAREYSELVRVEKELAKQRQQEHGSTAPGRKNTSGDITGSVAAAGEAKEKAAAKVGMGRQKAERAAAVVEEIDKAEAAGDAGRAAELRRELNEGAVAAAHRSATGHAHLTVEEQAAYRRLKKTNPDIATRFAGREIDIAEAERLASAAVNQQEKGPAQADVVDETGQKVPQHLRGAFAWRSRFDAMLGLHKQIVAEARKASEMPASRLKFNDFKLDADNARNTITFARPHAVCRPCKGVGQISGKTCEACKGSGWLTKGEFGRLPKSAEHN